MMQDFRNEVQQFLTSEVGQATVRGPLALGVASGALLLSQAVHTPSAEAQLQCYSNSDCGSEGACVYWCEERSNGTCTDWHSECRDS